MPRLGSRVRIPSPAPNKTPEICSFGASAVGAGPRRTARERAPVCVPDLAQPVLLLSRASPTSSGPARPRGYKTRSRVDLLDRSDRCPSCKVGERAMLTLSSMAKALDPLLVAVPAQSVEATSPMSAETGNRRLGGHPGRRQSETPASQRMRIATNSCCASAAYSWRQSVPPATLRPSSAVRLKPLAIARPPREIRAAPVEPQNATGTAP